MLKAEDYGEIVGQMLVPILFLIIGFFIYWFVKNKKKKEIKKES